MCMFFVWTLFLFLVHAACFSVNRHNLLVLVYFKKFVPSLWFTGSCSLYALPTVWRIENLIPLLLNFSPCAISAFCLVDLLICGAAGKNPYCLFVCSIS
jgi:hypothetical protein